MKVQGLNHNVYTEKKKRLHLLSWSKESQQDVYEPQIHNVVIYNHKLTNSSQPTRMDRNIKGGSKQFGEFVLGKSPLVRINLDNKREGCKDC